MSDHGYLLIQAVFQALQLYSWGFALIKLFRKSLGQSFDHSFQADPTEHFFFPKLLLAML